MAPTPEHDEAASTLDNGGDATSRNDTRELAAILLNLCHDYLTQASAHSRAELADFLRGRGVNPNPVDWLTDMLHLTAHDIRAHTSH